MKRHAMLQTLGLIAGALFLCAQMSAELTVRRCQRAAEAGAALTEQPHTVLALFLGKLEALVGNVLLLKADNYFHGQTSLLGHTRLKEEVEEEEGPGHDAEHEHDNGALGGLACHGAGLAYNHPLYRLYTKVAPTAHVHLDRSAEIVPWLYASLRLNPGNERAALVTTYWLSKVLDRPHEAEAVLRSALGERPSSWRLRAELAWLHYDQGRFGPALRQCESAIQLFRPGQDEEQARSDRAELWRLASACHEALGDLASAVACAERVVELQPASAGAREHLERLRAGN